MARCSGWHTTPASVGAVLVLGRVDYMHSPITRCLPLEFGTVLHYMALPGVPASHAALGLTYTVLRGKVRPEHKLCEARRACSRLAVRLVVFYMPKVIL